MVQRVGNATQLGQKVDRHISGSLNQLLEICRWFLINYYELGVLFFYLILRVTYEGTIMYLIKFIGKP